MNARYINSINIKKLKAYKGKSLFLIIPIAILVLIGIVVSSQAANIQSAAETSIFGTAEESGRLIELSSNQRTGGQQDNQRAQMIFGGNTEYTESDVDTISAIEHIDFAALSVTLPINKIVSDDVLEGTVITLNNLRALDERLAGQYTQENFTYIEGEPIPIILNANAFMRTNEDWGGQTEITINVGGMRRGANPEDIQNQSPITLEALPYDKDTLLGKEITLSFGGLDDLQTFEQEFTGSGMLFRKLTDATIAENEEARKDAISPYWDYAHISTPITYTFNVVGVIEQENSFASFIPKSFATTLMQEYIQHQLDARTNTELATSDLTTTFYGMTYDGVTLRSGFSGIGGFTIRRGGPGSSTTLSSEEETQTSYTIPGLVIATEREEGDANAFQGRMLGGTAEATGVYTDPKVFDQAAQTSDSLLIRIDDIANRSRVVEALNAAGYAYQDLNDREVFSELQNTMHTTVTIVTVSFIILTTCIIVLTMGKFVSESRKEIGVFRAIGATKRDIKQIFISQAVLYTIFGYLIGAVLGIGLVLASATIVEAWFNGFIEKTVSETFTVVQQIDPGIFSTVDWSMFALYTGLLLIISLVISLIPASRASRISPIEAIKSE